jgi:DNA invertase Pin-like site-specific DNA recombinase
MGITVIGICRVSSLEQSYQRQIDEIKDYCEKQGWNLKRIFTNKISGGTKIEQRSEIMEMMDYIKNNHVDKVIALSVDRIGRSVAEASKIIAFLNEHKVSLFIKNYNMETLNPDGTINIMGNFLMNLLFSVAEWEKMNIRERLSSGYQAHLRRHREDKENYPLGKPKNCVKTAEQYRQQYPKEISLLRKCISLRNIQAITGTSVNTLRRLKDYI